MAKNYDNSSIDYLVGEERIRARPAAMLGSSGLAGARHGFIEMYGNALDERSAGFGDRMDITYHADGSVSIRDYGRGVPLGWNDNPKVQNWNWHAVYNELYGGGKYDNGQWYLSSIDKDSIWSTSDKNYDKLCATLVKELGVDLEDDVPADGKVYQFKDINIRKSEDGSTVYLRVNNTSWSMLTWEALNKRLNYLGSVGLNGLGAASTQYSSEFFNVKSFRDGKCTSRSFKQGRPLVDGKPYNMFTATKEEIRQIPEEVCDSDELSGTYVHWKPDNTVFDDVNLGEDWLLGVCQDIADVAGIDLHFKSEMSGKDIVIPAGDLRTLAIKHCGEENIKTLDGSETVTVFSADAFDHGQIIVEGSPFTYVCKADIKFCAVSNGIEHSCYHNSVKMNTGLQYTAISKAIADFMNDKARRRGIKLDPMDYRNVFGVFVSTVSNYASFENQTKTAVDNVFIHDIIYKTLFNELNINYSKGNHVICDAVEAVMKEAEIRIATREYAQLKRETEKIKREKVSNKFTSCSEYEKKLYDRTEIWIGEGDSAANQIIEARNKDFQAIYAIRGKGLNVLKANIKRILKNKEIRELFSIIGTGFDLNIRGEKTFKYEDLRFNKIIFATDADEDGYQIRVLLFCIFYKLAPELLRKGHIYIAETPRFRIELTNGTNVYALNEKERDQRLQENIGKVRKVQRLKGLGEVDAKILRETTVHPDYRRLVQVSCDFENEFERDLIDALFGQDKYKQRKEILKAVLNMDDSDLLEDNALAIESEEIDDEEEEMGVDA